MPNITIHDLTNLKKAYTAALNNGKNSFFFKAQDGKSGTMLTKYAKHLIEFLTLLCAKGK